MKKIKKLFKTVVLIAVIGIISYGGYKVYLMQKPSIVVNNTAEADVSTNREKFIQSLTEEKYKSAEFQARAKAEARAEVIQDQYKQYKDDWTKIQNATTTSFSIEKQKASSLKSFLSAVNPNLVAYADEIVQLPRWIETVAIAGQETEYCKTGVARSNNNCGGVKNSKGGFKSYTSPVDSLRDISKVINSPAYKDKTISEMNGTYCVYEEGPTGSGPCPHWSTNINRNVDKILSSQPKKIK